MVEPNSNDEKFHSTSENLFESLEFYKEIIDNETLGFLVINQDRKIQNYNSAFAALFGYKKDEFLNLSIFDLLSQIKVDTEKEEVFVKKFLNNESIENQEAQIRKKNGDLAWIYFYTKSILNNRNEVIGNYFIGIDITNQKKIEDNLTQSEEKYRGIFDSMKSAVVIYEGINKGQDFIFKDFNKSAEQIEKVSKEELIGKNIKEIFPGVEDFGLLNVFRRVWYTGIPEKHPLSYYKDDRIGGWRENYVYKLSSGEIVAIYEDLTYKVKHDQILRESENNLNQVLNFEKMITSISSRFVGQIDFDKAINNTLKNIGISKMVSRVYLFSFTDSKEFMNNTHEWCNEGIEPHTEVYKNAPVKDFPVAMENIFQGKYISVEDSSNLTNGAINLKKKLSKQNVKATLAYPIYIREKTSGFIGFDDEINPRIWNPEDYSLLKITSQIIGNVLERKRIENNLRESEEKYRLISEDSDDLIIVYNEKLTIDYLNETTHSRVLGYPSHLYWKQSFRNLLVHKDDLNFAGPIIKEGYKKGSYKVQIRFKHIEGQYLWFEIKAKSFYDKNGVKKLLVVGREITDIKLAEQKTKESEKKYREILENIKEGYYEVDLEGNFTFINDAVCEITGYSREEVLNMNFGMLCDEKTRQYLYEEFKDLNTKGRGFKILEYQQLNKNKEIHFIESSVYLRFDSKQKIIGVRGVVRDVSDRKKSEALRKEFNKKLEEEVDLRTLELADALEKQKLYLDQIIKASQFKTEFLATMSHELRTPLNAIIGFTDLLLEGVYGKLNTEQLEFVNDIKVSAEHQFDMIKHILDISKIESGQTSLKIETFQLNKLIESLVSTLRPFLDEKDLKFDVIGLKNKVIIRADRLKVKQIVYNLIINAIKFTKEGSITLEFQEAEREWEFKVTDTGIGIAKGDFEDIFKDFKRVRSDYVDSTPGSGLGLALTKRIVELHGGTIDFESILGTGSSFSFTIPKEPLDISQFDEIENFLRHL